MVKDLRCDHKCLRHLFVICMFTVIDDYEAFWTVIPSRESHDFSEEVILPKPRRNLKVCNLKTKILFKQSSQFIHLSDVVLALVTVYIVICLPE